MRDQNSDQNAGAVVSPSQVVSAGLASAAAALVTSRFGVAGTLLGAAITAMIITGGSAILKAYLESVTGHVRKVPGKLRSRRHRKTERFSEPATMPDRPDLRDNFAGRMRAALGWFSNLPQAGRRPILVKGAIAAAIAFVICMGAVFAVEKGIGNSLSCGFWGTCPVGATPGIHPLNFSGAGAGSSISGGGAQAGGGVPVPDASDSGGGGGLFRGVPGGGEQAPAGGSSASPAPSDPGASPAPSDPGASPAPSDHGASPAPSDSGASPAPSGSDASPASQAEEPAPADSSASPAPGDEEVEQPSPSDSSASPAAPAGRENAPAGASPDPAQ